MLRLGALQDDERREIWRDWYSNKYHTESSHIRKAWCILSRGELNKINEYKNVHYTSYSCIRTLLLNCISYKQKKNTNLEVVFDPNLAVM